MNVVDGSNFWRGLYARSRRPQDAEHLQRAATVEAAICCCCRDKNREDSLSPPRMQIIDDARSAGKSLWDCVVEKS